MLCSVKDTYVQLSHIIVYMDPCGCFTDKARTARFSSYIKCSFFRHGLPALQLILHIETHLIFGPCHVCPAATEHAANTYS